jgi:hypothetical protein
MARASTKKLLQQLMQGVDPLQQNALIGDVFSGMQGANIPQGTSLEKLLNQYSGLGSGYYGDLTDINIAQYEDFLNQSNKLDDILAKGPAAIGRNKEAIAAAKGTPSLFSPEQLKAMEVPKLKTPAVIQPPAAPGPNVQQLSLFDDVLAAGSPPPPPNFVLQGGPYVNPTGGMQLPAVIPPATTGATPVGQAAQAAAGTGKAGGLASKLAAAGKSAGAGIGGATKGFIGNAGKLAGKLSAAAPGISTGLQIVDSGTALGDLARSTEDVRDLERQLLADSYGEGYNQLGMDEQRQIQQLRRGRRTQGDELGSFLRGAGSGAGGAAITGALGLIPGMQWLLPLAAAQLATSGVKGITKEKQNQEVSLQNLYNRLQGRG